MSQGRIIIVSGPSGVGKGTILRTVMQQHESLHYSVSATSRPMRPEDREGMSYYFVSRERFEEMIAQDELLEYAEYVGNYYGTPLAPIREAMENGLDIVMDVEVIGAKKIKARVPEAVLVFVAASSLDAVRQRLIARGDVSPEAMEERLKRAVWECSQAEGYDYIVLNDDVDHAVRELRAIMVAEKCKTVERIHLLKEEF